MMKNEMKTNNKTALLAILAVFAMVAAGAAVVMASEESDATWATGDVPATMSGATITADRDLNDQTGALKYLVKPAAALTITLPTASAEANSLALYIVPSAYAVTITQAAAKTSCALTIYVVDSDSSDKKYYTEYAVTVPAVTAAGANVLSSVFTITDADDTPSVSRTVAANPLAVDQAFITDDVQIFVMAGQSVELKDIDSFTIPATAAGTFTVTQTVAAESAQNGTATYAVAKTAAAGSVTFTYNPAEAGMTITTATANTANGTLTLVSGVANVAIGSSFKDTATLSFIANKAVTGAAIETAAALLKDTRAVATNDFVYGTIKGGETTIAYNVGAVNFVKASGNVKVCSNSTEASRTVVTHNVALDATSVVITNAAAAGGAPVALNWTAGDITLTSGEFNTANETFEAAMNIGTGAILNATNLVSNVIDTEPPIEQTYNPAIKGNLQVRGTLNITVTDNRLIVVQDANVSVYGTIEADHKTTIIMKNTDVEAPASTITFKANAGSTLTKVSVEKCPTNNATYGLVTIDLSGATGTVYLSGTISDNAVYSQTQAVIVNGDLFITGNAVITIQGSFDVEEGVTVTVTKGTITINSELADVEILGDILIEENGFLNIAKTKALKISAEVDNFGKFYSAAPEATLAAGATLVNEDAAYFKATALTIASGATMSLAGVTDLEAAAGKFLNKGAIVLDGTEFAKMDASLAHVDGNVLPYITMGADDATVDIKSFAFVDCGAATGCKLTIDDSGITSTKYESGNTNKIELTAAIAAEGANVNMGLSGIYFESSTSTSRAVVGQEGKYYLDRTLSMSGIAAINDIKANPTENPVATINLVNNALKDADFQLATGMAIGKGIKLDVDDNMTISGIVILTDATIDAAGGDLVISGLVASNKQNSVTGTVSAVSFSVSVLTDVTYYYSDLAGALETIEEIEENVTLTVSGLKNVVAEDVTIPENVRIAGAGTIKISPATVTVSVEDGATSANTITFDVKGTLAVENVKKFTPVVISDVTVTVGNAAEYTSLNRALAEAEVGDVITVTKEGAITIESNLTIPAGVVLVIPDDIDASVNVAKKVTITVDGVLMCNGITGPFGTEVSATAAVMKVSGLAMIGANSANKIDDYANYYKVSGAYWYLSDATGDFVYIGSLEDAIASKQAVKVYGKVTETESVVATKKIDLVAFTYEVPAGKTVVPTVLTVSDLGLYNASAAVAIEAHVGTTLKGQVTIPNAEADAIVSVNDFVGTLTYNYNAKGSSSVVSDYDGALTVKSGIIYINEDITPAATDSLTVQAGAEFVVTGAGVEMIFNANVPATIAGTLTAENGGSININSAKVILTGLLYAEYDSETKAKGTLTIANLTFTSGTIMAADGAQIDVTNTLKVGVLPGTTGAAPAIDGKVVLTAPAVIIAYPGADVSGMVIGEEGDMVSTALTLDGKAIATVYADKNDGVMLMDVIAQIPIEDIVGIDRTDALAAKADPARWGITAATAVGDVAQAGTTVKADKANVKISVSTGMSIWIDGVRYNTGDMPAFTVGSHTVAVTVNPGYKYADGTTPTITFNGKALSGLLVFEVTASMTAMDYVVLSAIGDVVVDQPDYPEQEKEDNSMIMILLGVLVVMVVILAIVTVIRMMRS